jgi:hypothetical protein
MLNDGKGTPNPQKSATYKKDATTRPNSAVEARKGWFGACATMVE